ncbi:MAG: class II aldolase/adducin family protein, partial [Candidatus Tectomicrobia bacterium]|nr:class II aldolase/adducin family protein [Candidatus Tectomicrobia bacterium]
MENCWSDAESTKLQGLDLLLYASRLIGLEESLVIWGGGNTSMKLEETDFRDRPTRVLRIKGSGSDLKTIEARHFPGVRLDDVLPLLEREEMSDEEMVEYLTHTLMEPQAARPSIETLLHAFLPYPHIYHTHADAILSLTNLKDGRRVMRDALGAEVVFIPYIQPGFQLAKLVAAEVGKSPCAPGAVLEKHGLFTWGESAKEAYSRTIDLVGRAEQYIEQGLKKHFPLSVRPVLENKPGWRREHVGALAPVVRGALSRKQHMVLLYDDCPEVLEFVNSE